MPDPLILRDLIYLDMDKAASVFSQLEGGLVQEVQTGSEDMSANQSTRKLYTKFFNPEWSKGESTKVTEVEYRIPHHTLLAQIEEDLSDAGLLTDLNISVATTGKTVQENVDIPKPKAMFELKATAN